jgi:hypothetical protein
MTANQAPAPDVYAASEAQWRSADAKKAPPQSLRKSRKAGVSSAMRLPAEPAVGAAPVSSKNVRQHACGDQDEVLLSV